MIEKGKVVKLLASGQAEVELDTSNCGGCKSCLTSCTPVPARTVIVANIFKHKVGDEVELTIPSSYLYKAFFLVFVLPLIMLILTIVVIQYLKIKEDISFFAGMAVFGGSYYFANRYDKKLRNKNIYKIIS